MIKEYFDSRRKQSIICFIHNVNRAKFGVYKLLFSTKLTGDPIYKICLKTPTSSFTESKLSQI